MNEVKGCLVQCLGNCYQQQGSSGQVFLSSTQNYESDRVTVCVCACVFSWKELWC